MAHKYWEDLIPFYIAQTLPEGQARELAQHLRTCDSCRYVYDEWREISVAVVLAADEWSLNMPPLSAAVCEHVAKGRSEEATQRTPKVVRQANTEVSTQRSMPPVPTMVTSTPPAPTPPYTNAPVFGAAPPPPKLIILPQPVRKRQSALPLVMAAAAVIVFLLIGALALVGLQAILNNGGRTPNGDNIAMHLTETLIPTNTLESAIIQRTSATPTNTLTPPVIPPNNTSAKLPTIEPTLDPSSFEMTLATEEISVTEDPLVRSMLMDATPEGGGNFTAGDCPELYFVGSACEVQVEALAQGFEFGMIVKRSDQDMALVIFDDGTIGEPTRVDALIGAPLEGQFAPDFAFMPYYRTGLGWAIDNPQTYGLQMSRTPDGTIQMNLPDERVILITSDLAAWTTFEP